MPIEKLALIAKIIVKKTCKIVDIYVYTDDNTENAMADHGKVFG